MFPEKSLKNWRRVFLYSERTFHCWKALDAFTRKKEVNDASVGCHLTKWLTAKQSVRSLFIIPNRISFFERESLKSTTLEDQSLNSFKTGMACVHSMDKYWWMIVWSAGQKGQRGESSFFILNSKLFVHRMLWIILFWNIDSFTSEFVAWKGRRYNLP